MTRRTVLLTGFEPFAAESINPSWEVVRSLDGWQEADFVVVAAQLPCVFGAALHELRRLIEQLQPALLIAVGQAGNRPDISVERIAINIDDARIADNAGNQPIDVAIVPEGPAAYFSTLPIKAIVHALRESGIPASISQSAGTFVCNHVFYGAMHIAANHQIGLRAGFIHIPYLPEQAARHPGAASLARDTALAALQIAVRIALGAHSDLHETGGQLD